MRIVSWWLQIFHAKSRGDAGNVDVKIFPLILRDFSVVHKIRVQVVMEILAYNSFNIETNRV